MLPTKTILLWSSGLVGGGGSIAVGSVIFTEAYPTGDTQLTRQGLEWSPMKPDMGRDISTDISSSFNFPAYNCFKTFFPGVEVGTGFIKNGSDEKEILEDPLKDVETPNKGNEENKTSLVGCALVGFSHQAKENQQQPDLVLKSEVVVKNENFGWALWGGLSRKGPSSASQDLKYRLIFLKKESDKWSILGGYMWSDYEFSTDGQVMQKLHILVPDGSMDWVYLMRESSANNVSSYREYFGSWKYSEEDLEESREIFGGIKIYGGASESNAEILGKRDGKFNDSIYGIYGFQSAPYSYSQSDKGWLRFHHTKVPNIKDTLNKLYAPFLGKKGKWENMQEFCSNNRYGRFLDEGDMDKLKRFCYSAAAKTPRQGSG